jgi:hypothetical protein
MVRTSTVSTLKMVPKIRPAAPSTPPRVLPTVLALIALCTLLTRSYCCTNSLMVGLRCRLWM